MRGKVDTVGRLWYHIGITPAYAGKSEEDHSPTQKKRDHPRLCGEKVC